MSADSPDATADQTSDESVSGDEPTEGSAVTDAPFKAIIDADVLESLFDAVGALVEECKIHLNDGRIRISAVDPANVGMVDADLDAGAFESYHVDSDRVIGVDLNRFEDIVGMADSGQLVKIELDAETRKLEIEIGALEYNLALIDPSTIRDEPDIPDLGDDLPARAVVEGRDLDRATTAADMVSDHVSLRVDADTEEFSIHAEGDTDDVELTFTDDDLLGFTPGAADSLFSLDYLKDMAKPMNADTEVAMDMGDDFPVKLHYSFADGDGHTTFALAPRIQS